MKTQNLKNGLLSIVLMFIFNQFIIAQDIMTLKNGDELNVRILEISETEIKYKNQNDNDGPLRILFKSDVFSIKYENGTKSIFNSDPIIKKETVKTKTKFDSDTSDFAKIKHKIFNGPRVGITYITPGTSTDYLSARGKQYLITQFGWQFEKRIFTLDDGTNGIIEFIPLVGGVEQGLFLPSASFLIGIRSGNKNAFEFAVGPNLSVIANYKGNTEASMGVVLAVGTSFQKGKINFPINLAFTPSIGSRHDITNPSTNITTSQKFETGAKISLLVGFNSRKK